MSSKDMQDQNKSIQVESESNLNDQNTVEGFIDTIQTLGFEQFQQVIALGRWPDGRSLTQAEQPLAMQALLVYEHRHVPLEARTGFIHKARCKSS